MSDADPVTFPECGGIPSPLICLNEGPDCAGPVRFHLRSSDWVSFARCDKHQIEREDQRQNSMERYADSPLAPAWFDPDEAGERWDEDD